MSDLRQRSPSFGKAGLKNERNDYTTSPTISPTSGRLFTRILYAVSAGAALFYISFLNTRGIDLPHTYALCSKDGPNIYTVDPAKPQVECIAIQGSEILSTGSFGELQGSLRTWKRSCNVKFKRRFRETGLYSLQLPNSAPEYSFPSHTFRHASSSRDQLSYQV